HAKRNKPARGRVRGQACHAIRSPRASRRPRGHRSFNVYYHDQLFLTTLHDRQLANQLVLKSGVDDVPAMAGVLDAGLSNGGKSGMVTGGVALAGVEVAEVVVGAVVEDATGGAVGVFAGAEIGVIVGMTTVGGVGVEGGDTANDGVTGSAGFSGLIVITLGVG